MKAIQMYCVQNINIYPFMFMTYRGPNRDAKRVGCSQWALICLGLPSLTQLQASVENSAPLQCYNTAVKVGVPQSKHVYSARVKLGIDCDRRGGK